MRSDSTCALAPAGVCRPVFAQPRCRKRGVYLRCRPAPSRDSAGRISRANANPINPVFPMPISAYSRPALLRTLAIHLFVLAHDFPGLPPHSACIRTDRHLILANLRLSADPTCLHQTHQSANASGCFFVVVFRLRCMNSGPPLFRRINRQMHFIHSSFDFNARCSSPVYLRFVGSCSSVDIQTRRHSNCDSHVDCIRLRPYFGSPKYSAISLFLSRSKRTASDIGDATALHACRSLAMHNQLFIRLKQQSVSRRSIRTPIDPEKSEEFVRIAKQRIEPKRVSKKL